MKNTYKRRGDYTKTLKETEKNIKENSKKQQIPPSNQGSL